MITNKMIHPELRKAGKFIRYILPFFLPSTFRKANRLLRRMKGKCGKGIRYEQIWLLREGSQSTDSKLRLCVYRPLEQKANAPGVLWMHGGGYGFGIPEQDEGVFRDFMAESGCVIVAPDYCLSVEKPYPAALEDCYAALLWLRDNAVSLGVRADQLMVAGKSAGGGLAAALAIYARDRGAVSVAFQMPLYPMLDDRMITKSSRDNDAPLWNTKSNETGWRLYLGAIHGTENIPAYAAPARLTDFHGLPPAFTFVGSIEPFCDETAQYMERLKDAGVPVTFKVFDGCYHAFDVIAKKSSPAVEAKKLMAESLRHAVANYFAEQPGK